MGRTRKPKYPTMDDVTDPDKVGEKPGNNTKTKVTCPVCGRLLSSPHGLIIHMRLHSGDKPYECPQCQKGFTNSTALAFHQRIHTGIRPFECGKCGKSYVNQKLLAVHMEKAHQSGDQEEERRYKCPECPRRFRESSSLGVHRLIHTGVKPYTCSTCSKSFRQLSNLQVHERIHTGDKPYKCSFCPSAFRQSSNLQVHLAYHAGNGALPKAGPKRKKKAACTTKCPVCQEDFKSKVKLNDHFQRAHLLVPTQTTSAPTPVPMSAAVELESFCQNLFTPGGTNEAANSIHMNDQHHDERLTHSMSSQNALYNYQAHTTAAAGFDLGDPNRCKVCGFTAGNATMLAWHYKLCHQLPMIKVARFCPLPTETPVKFRVVPEPEAIVLPSTSGNQF